MAFVFSRKIAAASFVGALMIAASPALGTSPGEPSGTEKSALFEMAATSEPVVVGFRDLFSAGAPSDRVQALAGSVVEIAGYFAPPEEGLPFRVLVGVPTKTCPYCDPAEDEGAEDALPFVLVYPREPVAIDNTFKRVRVTGRLEADAVDRENDGVATEIRLVDAVLEGGK